MLKEIPGYAHYFADKAGNVWSTKMSKEPRKLKMRLARNGYGIYWFRKEGKTIAVVAHRVVASAFWGEIPKGIEVNHKDLNKANNSLENLELITRSENYKHAVSNGAMKYGEKHPMAKLSNTDVIEIRRLLSLNIKQADIAKQFNVSQSTIYQINSGLHWAHVK